MKIGIIIQARMGSTRLPGKSFIELEGKPSAQYIIESIKQLDKGIVKILATSDYEEDKVLFDFYKSNELEAFQGSQFNVASRYAEIIKDYELDFFFRIPGDTPLYDHRIIEKGLELLESVSYDIDFISSMPNRGYPMGMNLELFNCSTFMENISEFDQDQDIEHVTSYFYRNLSKFSYQLVDCGLEAFKYEDYKFSIDTREDLMDIRSLVGFLEKPHFEYDFSDLCKFYKLIQK